MYFAVLVKQHFVVVAYTGTALQLAEDPQTTQSYWGCVLPMQLSVRCEAPYALASGGVLVFPGWLINH